MTRPSDHEIDNALVITAQALAGAVKPTETEQRILLNVLAAATRPREVWPAKEAAACLGVETSNMKYVRGLSDAVAYEFPRPQMPKYPDRTEKLYWRDIVEALAEQRRAGKGGS